MEREERIREETESKRRREERERAHRGNGERERDYPINIFSFCETIRLLTTGPRAVLTMKAVFFISAKSFAPT